MNIRSIITNVNTALNENGIKPQVNSQSNYQINSQVNSENNNNQVNASQEVYKTTNHSADALKIIRSLSPGDTFNGSIVDSEGATLTISMGSRGTFTATLLKSSMYNIGDNVRFIVSGVKGDNVMLKALSSSQGLNQGTFLNNALTSAELPKSERNLEMAQEMFRNAMSLDKDTLLQMAKEIAKFPGSSAADIVKLTKMELPITEENLKAMENYRNYNSSVQADAGNLADSISQNLDNAKMLKDVLLLLNNNTSSSGPIQSEALPNQLDTAVNSTPLSNEASTLKENLILKLEQSITEIFKDFEPPVNTSSLTEHLKGNMSLGDFSTKFANTLANLETLSDGMAAKEVKQLLKSSDMNRLLELQLKDTLEMDAGEITKENALKEHIAKSLEKLSKLESYANSNGASNIAGSASNMKNNMNFLNDLNQFVAAAQIPLKNIGDHGEGELYVYNRKKGTGKEENDTTKAFLHLDMEHLGPVDVYVTLTGKNVTTNFAVADDSILDFLEANISLLNDKLIELGYNTDIKVTDSKDLSNKGFSFEKDVIEAELPSYNQKRYKFDMKV